MRRLKSQGRYRIGGMRPAQSLASRRRLHFARPVNRLETPAGIVYISLKFLVGMTKSGSTRSRSFLLPADIFERTTGNE